VRWSGSGGGSDRPAQLPLTASHRQQVRHPRCRGEHDPVESIRSAVLRAIGREVSLPTRTTFACGRGRHRQAASSSASAA
jgi:hypothetical protein